MNPVAPFAVSLLQAISTPALMAQTPNPTPPIQGAVAEAHSTDSAQAKLKGTRPAIREASLKMEFVSMSAGFTVDSKSIETEIRDWLEQSGLQLVDSTKVDTRRGCNLNIKAFVQRTEDKMYWHAIVVDCFPIEMNGIQPGKGNPSSNPAPTRTHSSHLLAQRGEATFRENLTATIRRSLLELIGDSLTPVKASDHRWLRGRLRNTEHIPDPNVIHFNFEVLKIKNRPAPPAYPVQAKERGIQGTVEVGILVDSNGVPTLAEALSGPSELLETAVDYALKLEFEPATLNGKPRDASFKLTMPFKVK